MWHPNAVSDPKGSSRLMFSILLAGILCACQSGATPSPRAPASASRPQSTAVSSSVASVGPQEQPIVHPTGDFRFSEGLAAVKVNGVYGYIDAAGTMIIPPRFSAAFSFKGGLARIELPGSDKQGFIDKQGAVIIPPQFMPASNFSEGLAAVTFAFGDSAFIDPTGKVVTPHFSEVFDFSGGLAPVATFASHGKFGFIDKSGNLAIPIRYDNVVVNLGPVFSEGLAAVGIGKAGGYKYGYIDATGAMTIPSQYDDAHPFREGLAEVRIGRMSGFIDKTGKFTIPLRDMVAFDFSGSYARVRTGTGTDSREGFIDKTGKMVIVLPIGWYAANGFAEGLAVVIEASAGGHTLCGYIDQAGSQVVSMQFDGAGTFSGGFALVQSKGKVGVIDCSGKIVVPLQFDG